MACKVLNVVVVPFSWRGLTVEETAEALKLSTDTVLNDWRWPSIFLVDRKGFLQPSPPAGAAFEKIEAAVDELMKEQGD